MRNLKLTIEYNGANFSGWQKQNGKRTVQGELETAFTKLCPNENDIVVEGSGRTDSGVHALGQVASVKIENPIPTSRCKEVLNSLLPKDIRIKKVENAKDDFHARFSAKKKTYRYLVKLGEDVSAFEGDFIAVYPYKDVDIETMKSASKVLIGKHDFQAFCSADTSVSNFEREIFDIKIEQNKKMPIFFLPPLFRVLVRSRGVVGFFLFSCLLRDAMRGGVLQFFTTPERFNECKNQKKGEQRPY